MYMQNTEVSEIPENSFYIKPVSTGNTKYNNIIYCVLFKNARVTDYLFPLSRIPLCSGCTTDWSTAVLDLSIPERDAHTESSLCAASTGDHIPNRQ